MWNTDVATTPDANGATITVNGQTNDINIGANFRETVISNAQTYGLGKFRLYLNEAEIKPSQAPATVENGHHIRLVPFDVAG